MCVNPLAAKVIVVIRFGVANAEGLFGSWLLAFGFWLLAFCGILLFQSQQHSSPGCTSPPTPLLKERGVNP